MNQPPRIVRRIVSLSVDGQGEGVVRATWLTAPGIFLPLLFLVSFLLPLVFGFRALFPFSVDTENSGTEVDPVFPESVNVQSQGAYLSVSHSPELNPTSGSDLLLTAWFKLRRLPSSGERMVLLSKAENRPPFNPGYSLSLVRRGASLRPVIYWRDGSGRGGWYRFGEIKPAVRTWCMFSLSFRQEDLLGLHYTVLGADRKPSTELLGGYRLPASVIASSSADLVVGALPAGTFRGKIGPVGIFSGMRLTDEFKQAMKRITRSPLSTPSLFSDAEVKLWIKDGKSDSSMYGHKVTFSSHADRIGHDSLDADGKRGISQKVSGKKKAANVAPPSPQKSSPTGVQKRTTAVKQSPSVGKIPTNKKSDGKKRERRG